MNRHERRAAEAQARRGEKKGDDTAINPNDAGAARLALLEARLKDILAAYVEVGNAPEPVLVCLLDADSCVLAHQIISATFGETGGVRIFVAAVGQFLQPNVRAALAEHVGDGIARARAGCLNVVFMAHQGTLPMTVNFLSTGQFVLRPIGSAL